MPTVAAIPKDWKDSAGIGLTFVVSTQCQMACPGCIVVQRQEARTNAQLSETDHVRFVLAVAAARPVGLVSIQGYEPLHDAAWPVTRALLRTGREVAACTAFVTNGLELPRRLHELRDLAPDGITVSLDSTDEHANDVSRGMRGAFRGTRAGLEAVAASALAGRVLVASILRPNRGRDLDGIPALLRSLGLTAWVVTPFLRFTAKGAAPAQKRGDIIRELLRLDAIAAAHGIEMMTDDEFDSVLATKGQDCEVVDFARLRVRRLRRDNGIVRLGPDGSLSWGTDILRPVDATQVFWNSGRDPVACIDHARRRAEARP